MGAKLEKYLAEDVFADSLPAGDLDDTRARTSSVRTTPRSGPPPTNGAVPTDADGASGGSRRSTKNGGSSGVGSPATNGSSSSAGGWLSDLLGGGFSTRLGDMERQRIGVYVATWNVGNSPPPDDLSPWLGAAGTHDVYAVGVQECEYEPRAGFATCEEDWYSTLSEHFGAGYLPVRQFTITPLTNDNAHQSCEDFFKAMAAGLTSPGEIRMSVFVRRQLHPHVSCVEHSLQTCGRVNGLSGNKGGLCVSMRVGDTALAFINVHLNAHAENWERRNADLVAINEGLRNGIEEFDVINQMAHVFFFGDLNYRLELTTEQVKQAVARRDWDALLRTDQLRKMQREGSALFGFQEGTIDWAPTFKMKKGSLDQYNSKERVPSYCDRVLVRSFDGLAAQQTAYRAVPEVLTSDHKPVFAAFDVECTMLRRPLCGRPCSRQLVLSNLHGEALEAQSSVEGGARSYAYVSAVFVSPSLNTAGQSGVASGGTLAAPSWSGEVHVALPDMADALVDTQHVMVAVRQKRRACVLERLGEAAVSLAGLRGGPGAAPRHFRVQLMRSGLPCGFLCGTVCVR